MATRKQGGTAKVTLDAKTAHRFASVLRDGLIASAAYEVGEPIPPPPPGADKVGLDPGEVARFVDHLRGGLTAGGGGGAKTRTPGKDTRKASSGKKTKGR